MKYTIIALGILAAIFGYLGYRSEHLAKTATLYLPAYAPAGDSSKLAIYENSEQLYYIYYPSNWVLHGLPKPFQTAKVAIISFTTNSSNPANGNDPVLSVYAEGAFGGNLAAKTVDEWVNSNEISNYAEVKNTGTIKIGDNVYTHFELRDSYPGTPSEPHLDFYALLRKRYPANSEQGDIPTDFIGFGIPSNSPYKTKAIEVIKSYHSWGVFEKR